MLPYINVLNRLDFDSFRSGQQLANDLGVTRATIHNCILRIEGMGIAVERVRGKGYKLCQPLDLLDEDIIRSSLFAKVRKKLSSLSIQQQVDSTNNFISQCDAPEAKQFSVLLAETQTAGRGRRGRVWQSPYGANVYMSVMHRMQKSLTEVGALSPLVALNVVQALTELGVSGLGVKWPNDIVCQDKKIAGLLIECTGEMAAHTNLIIGIGVNVHMSKQKNINIDQQWTDISSHIANKTVTRNEVVANLLNVIVPTLSLFDNVIIDTLVNDWAQWDIMKDKSVVLHTANEQISGVARGIDKHGYLLLDTEHGMKTVSAGDVSLRALQ